MLATEGLLDNAGSTFMINALNRKERKDMVILHVLCG
jgi:hypothetical protein